LGDVAVVAEIVDGGQADVLGVNHTVSNNFFVMLCDFNGTGLASSSPIVIMTSFVVQDFHDVLIEGVFGLIGMDLH